MDLEETTKKKVYVAPEVNVIYVELEEGIASGSAVIKPTGDDGFVNQEWEIETVEEDRRINW